MYVIMVMINALLKGIEMDKKEYLTIGGLVAFVLGVGAIASSVYVDADNTNAIDEVNISVPIACTMSGAIVTGHEHTASINPNTYEDDIGETTITTTCNDGGGYAIYAIGFTGDKYTGEDHTKLIGSSTGSKIGTGTGTSGNSQWAMKVTAVTGTYSPTIVNSFDSSSYHVVPDTYTKVATFYSTTDVGAGATGSSIKTTYAAYISGTQAADTYTGKVKYTLVHPYTETPLQPQVTQAGKICYYPNGSNVINSTECQNVGVSDTSATLRASNFSRTGYGFAGWNTEFDYSGTFYGPNEDISFTAGQYTGTNPGLSLYAVWVKSAGSLQDSSKVATVCSGLTQSGPSVTPTLTSVSALTDQRDNQTYAIAKLADGKCWMIENLRLADKDGSNNDIILSSANTNNPSLPLNNSWWYSSANDNDTIPTSNHLSSSTNPSTTAWCESATAACDDQSMLYKGANYGNHYNWYSAVAGSGTYSLTTGEAPGDICPAGWVLPVTGGSDGGYISLYVGLEAKTVNFTKYPNNFLYSGYVSGSYLVNVGTEGLYWSRVVASPSMALYFSISKNKTYASPASYNGRYYGYSVRCQVE